MSNNSFDPSLLYSILGKFIHRNESNLSIVDYFEV